MFSGWTGSLSRVQVNQRNAPPIDKSESSAPRSRTNCHPDRQAFSLAPHRGAQSVGGLQAGRAARYAHSGTRTAPPQRQHDLSATRLKQEFAMIRERSYVLDDEKEEITYAAWERLFWTRRTGRRRDQHRGNDRAGTRREHRSACAARYRPDQQDCSTRVRQRSDAKCLARGPMEFAGPNSPPMASLVNIS
jgi:hypothetical protein